MTPDHAVVMVAMFACTFLGSLAYRFGSRWLALRYKDRAEASRMDQLEADLKAHKETHAKAIANLVQEMRQEIGKVSTKASMQAGKVLRPGRFRV